MINEGFEYRERLGPGVEGRSVLGYLTHRYTHSTAAEWIARIESGQVLIDSDRIGCDTLIRRGRTLLWRRPPWNEPEVPSSFVTLFEDEDLLAVAKPAGLPTLPGANFLKSTLLYKVRERDPGAAPLHRLGRWTSGVVLFGRTREARAQLTREWPNVGKRYRALAAGDPTWNASTITAPIGSVPHAALGTIHAASTAGKASATRVVVLERRKEDFLCDAFLVTGRPHQIRIHLAAAGHPLVGDPVYVHGGTPRPEAHELPVRPPTEGDESDRPHPALPGDPGYLLHSHAITLRHPRTCRSMTIESEPPPALRLCCSE